MFLNARLNHTTMLSGCIRPPRSEPITYWHGGATWRHAAKAAARSGWSGIDRPLHFFDEEKSKPEIPFTNDELMQALNIEYEHTGYSDWKNKNLTIEFDDEALHEIKAKEHEDEGQLRFTGIEPPDYSKLLTESMRSEIKTWITDRLDKEAGRHHARRSRFAMPAAPERHDDFFLSRRGSVAVPQTLRHPFCPDNRSAYL
jgi:hypothetical protein